MVSSLEGAGSEGLLEQGACLEDGGYARWAEEARKETISPFYQPLKLAWCLFFPRTGIAT